MGGIFGHNYPSGPGLAIGTVFGRIAGSRAARFDVVTFAKGHAMNPMTEEDVNAKFDEICSGKISESLRDEIKAAWWGFDTDADLRDVIKPMASFATGWANQPASAH